MADTCKVTAYIDEHLIVLAQEVLHWKKKGRLEGTFVEELASLMVQDQGMPEYMSMRLAENAIANACMEYVVSSGTLEGASSE